MNDLTSIRDRWGLVHFEQSPVELLEPLSLRPTDAKILQDIGLPVSPSKALALSLRCEQVNIQHEPQLVTLLVNRKVEYSAPFPGTGYPGIDAWIDTSKFVAFGEVPNDYEPGSRGFFTRFICLDGIRGWIWWVSPKLHNGKINCSLFNTSLSAYLECLLVYKEWREECDRLCLIYPDEDMAVSDPDYQLLVGTAHKQLLRGLVEADPIGFKEGFWEFHAWNEAILFGVP